MKRHWEGKEGGRLEELRREKSWPIWKPHTREYEETGFYMRNEAYVYRDLKEGQKSSPVSQ